MSHPKCASGHELIAAARPDSHCRFCRVEETEYRCAACDFDVCKPCWDDIATSRRRKRLSDADFRRARTASRCSCLVSLVSVAELGGLFALVVLTYVDVGSWHAPAKLPPERAFDFGHDVYDALLLACCGSLALLAFGCCTLRCLGERADGAGAATLKDATKDESSGYEQVFFPPATAPSRWILKR